MQNMALVFVRSLVTMTRGDQRERDRAKNLKKQQQQAKGTTFPEGMTLAQKKLM